MKSTLRTRGIVFTLCALLLATASGCRTACQEGGGASASADRMAWFNQARFGMFIHWGIYSVPAGEWNGRTDYAEWIQHDTEMPADQYAKFAGQFDPVKYNPRQWVATAKAAGMKYIVITSKHHDGFCMFDTKLTDYNVVKATPWHHDPMKELADATRAAGLKFCFYYSVPDWHHPEFPAKYSQDGFHGAPNPNADIDKYVDYVKGQMRELLTQYGPISIIWFDGGSSFKAEGNDGRTKLMHSQEIIDLIHQLQPNCLVNNRLGPPGDYGTPEQKIPGVRPTNSFEVCMTLNNNWGYNKNDHHFKSPTTVIRNLVDIASKGGNYLVNVGPTPEGVIPPESVDILHHIGVWMKANGKSIYGTSASPLDKAPAWGRLTEKGDKIYLHVFEWPADGRLSVEGLKAKVEKAKLLVGEQKLAFDTAGDKLTITLPPQAPDPIDSVIVLKTESEDKD
jgi:alpha-L-fucosidase